MVRETAFSALQAMLRKAQSRRSDAPTPDPFVPVQVAAMPVKPSPFEGSSSSVAGNA